jgi:mono/diheme cytochrome c family protein
MECHGYNFEGKHFFNDEGLASVHSHNLTSGKGGVGAAYSDMDWIRSIRHGVNPSGKPIFVMPSAEFNMLCDADLGSIIAYIKSLPPVDNEVPAPVYENFGKFLLGAGAFGPNIINAEIIDHQKVAGPCETFASSADHGKYLVAISGCYGCHGPQLNGSKTPKPGSPFASNLTNGGNLANWSSEDFVRLMRSGVTKEGKSLDNYYMPWKAYGNYNDEELSAMFDYLKSLEALPTAAGG